MTPIGVSAIAEQDFIPSVSKDPWSYEESPSGRGLAASHPGSLNATSRDDASAAGNRCVLAG